MNFKQLRLIIESLENREITIEKGTVDQANEVVDAAGKQTDVKHIDGSLGGDEILLVAKIDDKVAGFILCSFTENLCLDNWTREVNAPHQLIRIATKKKYRGCGVASKLVQAAIKKAKFKKVSFIVWNCAADNDGSVALAKKFGGVEFPCPWWNGWRSFCIAVDEKSPEFYIRKYFSRK